MSRVFDIAPMATRQPFSATFVATPVKIDVLLDILQHQRFAGTLGEEAIIAKYLRVIPDLEEDDYGNLILVIPTQEGLPSQTLFSCHTDTVEKRSATGLKRLSISNGSMLHVSGGGVLGADDGTGMWLMLNLIEAKVPGTYIFHREEEIGGGGSDFLAQNHAEWLRTFERAIAFDRKGTNHVITHQAMGRCCSDTFAVALSEALNNRYADFDFAPNDGGSFTDTANYVELIPECTNISVGYYDQHSQEECQDLSFCTRLAHALIAVDWENLPTERDPRVKQSPRYLGNFMNDPASRDLDEMAEIIFEDPEGVARLLRFLGYDAYELDEALSDIDGYMTGEAPFP